MTEEQWKEYDGDREKEWHDIRLRGGKEIAHCYPNAETFHDWDTDKLYQDEDVTHIKRSKKQW